MRECPENFRESLTLTTATATFPEIFKWAFLLIVPMNVRTKFEVRSLPVRCHLTFAK